jgi:hypothetical protein
MVAAVSRPPQEAAEFSRLNPLVLPVRTFCEIAATLKNGFYRGDQRRPACDHVGGLSPSGGLDLSSGLSAAPHSGLLPTQASPGVPEGRICRFLARDSNDFGNGQATNPGPSSNSDRPHDTIPPPNSAGNSPRCFME